MEPINPGKKDLYRLYLATLFFALHYVLVIYINSSYLEKVLGEHGRNIVGLLYVAGSIISIAILSKASRLLRMLGNKTLMLMVLLIEAFCLLTLAFSHSLGLILTAFIIHDSIISMLYFNFDIFVEKFSRHEESGKARGTFLSVINICFVVTPLIGGLILEKAGVMSVYALSALLVIPVIYFISKIKNFKDSEYKDPSLLSTFKIAYGQRDLRFIIVINLILQMFYSAMVIYMPIYLFDVIGFSLQDIGLVFTVMLMPFVIFELPLGKISDSLLGEKEILITGIVIMGISTTILSLITSHAIVVWAALLFMTRVGASFVEIMAESYFFKKINNEDTELLSLWRSLNGFSYIIIPLLISGLLFFIDLRYIFALIGALIISGLFFALRITDTL